MLQQCDSSELASFALSNTAEAPVGPATSSGSNDSSGPVTARMSAEEVNSIILRQVKLTFFGISLAALVLHPLYSELPRDLDVAEIFTTAGSISGAARQTGLSAETFDWENPGQSSVLSQQGFWQCLTLVLRLKPGGLLTLAPDCSSFGFACRHWTQRNKKNPEGRADYTPASEGALFLFALSPHVIQKAARLCVPRVGTKAG